MEIGIIKLGAKGDVVRTLSILPAIKKKFPDSKITWITKSNIADILNLVSLIDNIHQVPLNKELNFDILYNLDFDQEATSLAEKIQANTKKGFKSEEGFPASYNFGAEEYLNTMFDDELKKNNKLTYQELIFKAADLTYNGEFCGLNLKEEDKKYAENFKEENNLTNKKVIGIHMGSGPRWPSKAWHFTKVKEFIKLSKSEGYEIILFGGPDEINLHKEISEELISEGIEIYRNNPQNSNREFASLISLCDVIVCSDSFALHISLALKKQTVGLFFCTSPNEIESYGFLTKVVSPKLFKFFPEKMNLYSENLVKSISPEEVLKTITKNK